MNTFEIPTIETFSANELEQTLATARCGSVNGSCYGTGTCGVNWCG